MKITNTETALDHKWNASEEQQGPGKIAEGDGGVALLESLQTAPSGVLDKHLLGHRSREKEKEARIW